MALIHYSTYLKDTKNVKINFLKVSTFKRKHPPEKKNKIHKKYACASEISFNHKQ